jgi:nitrogen fixation/metabolism regulation signal transduction histidine kinase
MKIRRKLLLSYLLITALFIAAGATIAYNTMKMGELQTKVEQQVEVNKNAYDYQQGLDQKQFGTLMYSADNIAGGQQEGEQIIVKSAELMATSRAFLLDALATKPELLAKFNEAVNIDAQIDNAITEVVTIHNSPDSTDANSTDNKYVQIWDKLGIIMSLTTDADDKLGEVRAATIANVQSATTESQSYANLSNMVAVAVLVAMTIVSVALAIVMGNRITGPLKKLAGIAHKVSLGDLDQRYYLKQKTDTKKGDEIDELVEAFRRMINAFRMQDALINESEETIKS